MSEFLEPLCRTDWSTPYIGHTSYVDGLASDQTKSPQSASKAFFDKNLKEEEEEEEEEELEAR